MKKVMILLVIALTANVMMAQKKDKTDAFMYNKNGQYEKAMKSVEKCVNHEQFHGMKPYDQATVWYYRAQIYQNILLSEDSVLIAKAPNAVENVYESLMKCMENKECLDENKADIYQRVGFVMGKYSEQGYAFVDAKDFASAAPMFKKTYDVAKTLGTPDANDWLNNAAQSYLLAKDFTNALDCYTMLKDNGVETGDVYYHIAVCYNGLNNAEQAMATINAGLEKFPSHANLIIEKVSAYLKDDRGAEAIQDLNKLYELDPTNVPVLFAIGTIYGNAENKDLYNPDQAIKFYEDAIKIDPDYLDAVNNLGVLYTQMAFAYIKQANEISGISKAELEQYNGLMDQANELLGKGLPYLEQVYEKLPSDEVKSVLRSIYMQLKMYDKVKVLMGE